MPAPRLGTIHPPAADGRVRAPRGARAVRRRATPTRPGRAPADDVRPDPAGAPQAVAGVPIHHRRRLAVVAVVALLTAVLTLLVGDVGASAGEPARVGTHAQAVVAPGETLWDVAVEHAPADSDPRAYLERIRSLNELDTGPVAAWTALRLPGAPGA